jgi:DTW domain-containing protein YfiP
MFLFFDFIEMDNIFTNATREACSKCGSLKKIYCDKCALPVPSHTPPSVPLPIKLEIWRHPGENSKKTTTTHALLTSPAQSTIKVRNFRREGLGELSDLSADEISRTLLLYPCADACNLADIPAGSFDKLIVIDGTWKQANSMMIHCSKVGFTAVRIPEEKTLFWRYSRLKI